LNTWKASSFYQGAILPQRSLLLALIGQFILQIIGEIPTKWQSLPNKLFLWFQQLDN